MTKDSPVYSRARSNGAAFPSLGDIEMWKRELARIGDDIAATKLRHAAEIAPLQSRYDAFAHMIDSAEAILPFVMHEVVPVAVDDPDMQGHLDIAPAPRRRRPPGQNTEPKTWTAVMESILQKVGRLSYDEMRTEIAKTSLAKKLATSDKGFYGAIAKLAEKKSLLKHNGWLFSPSSHAKLMADISAGLMTDEKAPSQNASHQSPFGDAIKAFMAAKHEGATSSEIIQELRKTPEFLDTIERHKTHAYNVLSRLVDHGELVKGGGKYFRAPNRLGAAA